MKNNKIWDHQLFYRIKLIVITVKSESVTLSLNMNMLILFDLDVQYLHVHFTKHLKHKNDWQFLSFQTCFHLVRVKHAHVIVIALVWSQLERC